MPAYMQTLWRSGLCPALVPVSFYRQGERPCRVLHCEGLTHIAAYALQCPDGIEDSFCLLLHALESAALSFLEAQRWLADPRYISLAGGDLFYDREKGKSLLLFCDTADDRPFLPRFCGLCEDLGGSGQLIAARLQDVSAACVLEERKTAAFLRGWRQEIREGQKGPSI